MAGFDPTHSVRFDLPRGSVIAGGEERHVLLPCAALNDLVLVAGTEAAAAVGRTLGASIGKRIAGRLGGVTGLRGSTLEEVVRDLAGELATLGLGVASVERWGRALVVAVERPAIADLPFLASILEGTLEAASEAPVRCTSLGRDGAIVRVLVAGEAAVGRARAMLDTGATWGDVLARLQRGGGGA
jgi:hypothetical protein